MGDGILLARIVLAIATITFALAVVQSAKAKAAAHRVTISMINRMQTSAHA